MTSSKSTDIWGKIKTCLFNKKLVQQTQRATDNEISLTQNRAVK
jgi:hypothetical protein